MTILSDTSEWRLNAVFTNSGPMGAILFTFIMIYNGGQYLRLSENTPSYMFFAGELLSLILPDMGAAYVAYMI